MAYEASQEVFLPVHGHVRLLPSELAVVDHPAFQRLRFIRQLGMAHLVFPGGSHSRFEHSLGAVHIAERIIRHVELNRQKAEREGTEPSGWEMIDISPYRTLIRLAALAHDLGHLPFGHTLEDELHHLPQHDGPSRLRLVADKPFPEYELEQGTFGDLTRPSGGWSLRALIDALYARDVSALGVSRSPFETLMAIVSKPASDEGWLAELCSELASHLPLRVCQDVVGNTICADFLDYLFRDWHHLGKPHFEDKRLYQYMEVRRPTGKAGHDDARFIINVGPGNRIRHDAITSILELLEARYKLAETVLFHRTKLALTALLDRCLLEISRLYSAASMPGNFRTDLESALVWASDDELMATLGRMLNGSTEANHKALAAALASERDELDSETTGPQPQLIAPDATFAGPIAENQNLARTLADRLKHRHVYALAYKLRMSDFPPPHTPENHEIQRIADLYQDPENRLKYLSLTEALCLLPAGSLLMYCPSSVKMNAKVAKANLLVEGDVKSFVDYENEHVGTGLTCGALGAQVNRFYQLWSAQVFVERQVWRALSQAQQNNLREILKVLLFARPDSDVNVARQNIQPSVRLIAGRDLAAARGGTRHLNLDGYEGTCFPSGLPFSDPAGDEQ